MKTGPVLLAVLFAFLLTASAWAQPAPAPQAPAPAAALPTPQSLAQDVQKALTTPKETPPAQLDQAQIQLLLGKVQNPKEREAFIKELKAMQQAAPAAAQEPPRKPLTGEAFLNALSGTASNLGKNFALIGRGFADLPQTSAWIGEQFSDDAARDRWLKFFMQTGVALGTGTLGFFLLRLLLRRPREMLGKMPTLSFPAGLLIFAGYHFLALLPVVAFTMASFFTLQWFEMPHEASQATAQILYAFIVLQLCMWILRMVFATRAPPRRLLPMDNETAAYLYVWLVRLSGLIVFAAFLSRAALALQVPEHAVNAFASLMGLLVTVMVIIIVLQNRRNVAEWLRGKQPTEEELKEESAREKRKTVFLQSLREQLAGMWHILAIIYLVVGYLVATLDVQQGFATLTRATVVTVVVLLGFHFFLRGIDRLVEKGFALPAELKRQFPHLEERTNSYLPLLRHVLKLAIWVVGVVVLLGAWGVDTVDWFTQPPGNRVLTAVVSVAITLFIAVLVWELVGSVIERYLRGDDRSGHRVERSARMRTLLPLVRYTAQILVVVVAGVVILSDVGVDTTPFLAGAGIIGLAIGFGSQALVKDFIGGLFILLEDIISVGDIIKIDNHSGTVEALTIRTVRLRDANGHVHTIPFGELTSVINMTKHYARVVLEIPVAFDADWRKVMRILKEIGEEMRKEEQFQKAIYEPLEVQGIDRYESAWAIVLARIKTQPLQQWNVKREYLLRLKERFDREGIAIPYPVSMNFPMAMIGENPQTPGVPATPQTPKTPV